MGARFFSAWPGSSRPGENALRPGAASLRSAGRALLAGVVQAAALWAAGPPDVPAAPEARFVNVATEAGVDAVLYCGGPDKDHILESTGSGAAFVDYDADGLLDIYLVNAWALDESPSAMRLKGRNKLYRNLGGGRFADVSASAGVDGDAWGCGICAGDYDNDGHTDLYVTNFGANRLYRNRGNGTFMEVAAAAGVADDGWGAGATFFDADGDGDLDLYVANYITCTMEEVLSARRSRKWRDTATVMSGPFGLRGGRDRLFINRGDGTFGDATDAAGLTDTAEGYGLGVLASDFDADGDVDLYVANDSNPNFFYRNNGNGKFTDISLWNGTAFNAAGMAQASMGLDAGDLDGDSRQDILVTNFARDYSTLYRNSGDLFFEDVSSRYGLTRLTYEVLSWGCAFFDFDLDADLDIIIVNGHIYPQVDAHPELAESYRQKILLLAQDDGRLLDISARGGPGLQAPISGRGLALGDYDDDGDLDLLITVMDSPPLLLRNDTPRRGHWLKVRLFNRYGSPAINARAVVTANGRRQLGEVRSGSTYQSQSTFDLHFGLGPAARAERLEVHWPGGRRTVEENVPADRTIVLHESAARAAVE